MTTLGLPRRQAAWLSLIGLLVVRAVLFGDPNKALAIGRPDPDVSPQLWTSVTVPPYAKSFDSLAQAQASAFELVGQIGGTTEAVAVRGSLAFIGQGMRMVVLDVADPARPRVIGRTPILPAGVDDIALEGNHAFLALGIAGVAIFDVSDPANPRSVASRGGFIKSVATDGRYAYVASAGGLGIDDVSNPGQPRTLAILPIPGGVEDVAVDGGRAFLAAGAAGFRIVDVANPAEPRLLGAVAGTGAVKGVAIGGNRLLFAEEGAAGVLKSVDQSDAANPRVVASLDLPGNPGALAIDNNHAYVTIGTRGVAVVDISAPAELRLASTINTPHLAQGVAVRANRAYVADTESLRIVDVSTPSSASESGSYSTFGRPEGSIVISGTRAYVQNNFDDWAAVDITDPREPAYLGEVGKAYGVAGGEGHVYVLTTRGLSIRVASGNELREIGFLPTPLGARGLAAGGDFVCIGGSSGVLVVNVSDPAAPVPVGLVETRGQVEGIAVAIPHAYAVGAFGLSIINLSADEGPEAIGGLNLTPAGTSVVVKDGYAYVSGINAGIRIVDASDATTPRIVGSMPSQAYDARIAVARDRAYVTDLLSIQIHDVADPSRPQALRPLTVGLNSEGIAAHEDHIYVADIEGGLLILRRAFA